MSESTTDFPRHAVGVVRGIEKTYVVDWIEPDLARLIEPSGEVAESYASSNTGGFINIEDVIEQGSDIVAEWDADNF